MLGYRKAGLRRAVQEEVNLYGQKNVKPNKAAAKRLMTAIKKLNTQIEDIDGVVNPRARSGLAKAAPAKKRAPAKKAGASKAAQKTSKR